MRFRLAVLILLLGVLGFTSYRATAAIRMARVQSPFAFFQPEPPPLPEVSLTDADIIRIMSNYNLKQQDSPVFCHQLYGLTSFDQRQIEICEKVDTTQKEVTLLHEIYHIRYHEVGIDTGGPYEPTIQAHAEARFHQLFGIQPPVAPVESGVPANH